MHEFEQAKWNAFHDEMSKIAQGTYNEYMQSNYPQPQQGGGGGLLPAAAGVGAGALGYRHLAGRGAQKASSGFLKGLGKTSKWGALLAGGAALAGVGAKMFRGGGAGRAAQALKGLGAAGGMRTMMARGIKAGRRAGFGSSIRSAYGAGGIGRVTGRMSRPSRNIGRMTAGQYPGVMS